MNGFRKPSVVMVVSEFPSLSQTFISLQIAELINRGYELILVNLGRKGKPEWAPEILRSLLDRITVIEDPRRVRVNPGLTWAGLKSFFALFRASPGRLLKFILSNLFRLRIYSVLNLLNDTALLRKCPPHEIVHCQFATLAHRVVRVRNFGLTDTLAVLVSSARGYDISSTGSLADTDWPSVCRETRMFLPVCRYFEPLIRNLGFQGEIRVVPSPVNTLFLDRFSGKAKKKGEGLRILSVGRLVEKKGFLDGVEALSLLNREGRVFEYLIVGEGPQKKELESLIAQRGLAGKAFLTGALPSEKTLELMADCDLLLAPCKTAGNGDMEGIPNVIKEAMYLGLQILATAHAGIPEIVENEVNGFLVSEGDIDALGKALKRVMTDRSGWEKRSRRARLDIKDRFSIEGTTNILEECYREVLSSRSKD